ncbi:MAG: glycoside hydrolase family 26 protein [Thermodesulfobacteriota bacterium]
MSKTFISPISLLLALLLFCPLLSGCIPEEKGPQAKPAFGLALEGQPRSTSFLRELEEEVGLPVRLINFFLQWPKDPDFDNFPQGALEAVLEFGAVPVLTWEPMYYDSGEQMIPAADILGGRYDRYITLFANRIKRLDGPVFIRFAHEMNLSRYHWGGTREEYGPESPQKYIKMFRHVRTIFKEQDARNAFFVFCPNNESLPNAKFDSDAEWNRVRNYYPGDQFVDILGMDGYNWGTTQTMREHGWESRWLSFEQIFVDIFQELKDINAGKPLYVFETSSVNKGGDRGLWIKNAFLVAEKWGIDGLIWFHADKEEDWRLKYHGEEDDFDQIREKIKTKVILE